MRKILQLCIAVLLSSGMAYAETVQFVSLNLCSDRLLIALARPEQIAAQSPYSKNPLMMLDKINTDNPTVEPQLHQLLPYLDKTVLINPLFYPQLVEKLQQLGVKVVPISEPQTPEELFALITLLGKLTGNESQAKQLIYELNLQNFSLNRSLVETLMLSDTGVLDGNSPPYRTLLQLAGLEPMKNTLTPQNFSLEKLLLIQPNQLVMISDKQGYNEQAELLRHPILQKIFQNRPLVQLPLKYSYCFDHGLWQGAEKIRQQIK
ncbi:helical backbone metal receptor [Pasteurellaceae bacterium Orientalotternb1]|nr:helical backbone metal receptor [Pasteurellaceae bacterium Orientalotternb1]